MVFLYACIATIFVVSLIKMFSSRSEQTIQETEAAKKKAEAEQKALAVKQEAERKRAEEQKAREEWKSKHGRFNCPIAGVTFNNEDGVSRQNILKDLKMRGGGTDLQLEEYDYKGKPAVRVLVDDMCVGNIPKDRVPEILGIMDRLEKANLEIEIFHPDDDEERTNETIYRADLFLIYAK